MLRCVSPPHSSALRVCVRTLTLVAVAPSFSQICCRDGGRKLFVSATSDDDREAWLVALRAGSGGKYNDPQYIETAKRVTGFLEMAPPSQASMAAVGLGPVAAPAPAPAPGNPYPETTYPTPAPAAPAVPGRLRQWGLLGVWLLWR